MGTVHWPETGPRSAATFVSDDDGEPGTWVPLCACRARLVPHSTTMTNWRCEACGFMQMIWAEDFPDAYEDACDECDAWGPGADGSALSVAERNTPGDWHDTSCSLHTDNIVGRA